MTLQHRTLIVFAGCVFATCSALPLFAQTAPAVLTGKVSSAQDGAMEGVVVSAKKGIVTVSVVSGKDGRFSFPATKLDAGDYALSVRATGYDLPGPQTIAVTPGKPATRDIALVPTKNLAAQLSNQEWMNSVPGTDDQRRFLTGCTACHTVQRIIESSHTAEEFVDVLKRMSTYSNNSFSGKPQARTIARDVARFSPNLERDTAYLASINRSKGELAYPLKTLPRVSGDGTKVIVTEYDLPHSDAQPHDVIVDEAGIVWYVDFGGQYLGRFDPKTLVYAEIPVPEHRAEWPKGALDLEVDPQGNMWMGLMFQGGVAKYDKTTGKMETMQLSKEFLDQESQQGMVAVQSLNVDNKIWFQDSSLPGVYRVDLGTGKTERFRPFENKKGPRSSVYGIYPDKANNLWFLDFGGENVGRIDAANGKVSIYPTPTKRSKPRRGQLDSDGRLWFAEFAGERVGMFDTKTEVFKEWEVPSKFFAPYDANRDRTGKIWTAGMSADRVLRLDPDNGQFTEFPLPHFTNVRRVFIDDTTTKPTFWTGNNHGATLIKVEPQD